MKLIQENQNFSLWVQGRLLMKQDADHAAIYVGSGTPTFNMHLGNFSISDYLIERIPLRFVESVKKEGCLEMAFSRFGHEAEFVVLIEEFKNRVVFSFNAKRKTWNRLWIRIPAEKDEKIFGCGKQYTCLNLRGKHFPLWTSEPGVGRNKKNIVTLQADQANNAGGDYYHTNYPQPTFLSTQNYFCHLDGSAYMDFDFRQERFHELQAWEIPKSLSFDFAEDPLELLNQVTKRMGRQPALPEWADKGIWLGLQGGTKTMLDKLAHAQQKKVNVVGLWIQDWEGKRKTSFGQRLMWNWKWDQTLYPDLDQEIHSLREKGIRVMGYINPYFAVDGDLFKEGNKQDLFVKNPQGDVYEVDFGEFDCGLLDLTMPKAFAWMKQVIRTNLIDLGLSGWMADFSEYLPTDAILHNGVSAEKMHNVWPRLWAKANYEAVQEAGKTDEILYFMRAGFHGFQPYCPLMWAGDQCVTWGRDDGIASVIIGALSAGISGIGTTHSDIGGYTSLFGLKRSKELFLRWAEMAAFTPIMRTHEGNRPYDNHQFDADDETIEHLAKMSQIFVKLAPYRKHLFDEYSKKGTPLQRPLFLHYGDDPQAYETDLQYLFGQDLLVAPVVEQGQNLWKVYLPEDQWISLWTKEEMQGKRFVDVACPIGQIPVFFRKNSPFTSLFHSIS